MKKLLSILVLLSLVIYSCKKDKSGEANVLLPEVSKVTITNITIDSATFSSSVTNEGETPVTARGFCWGVTSNPDLTNSFTINGSGSGDFTEIVESLDDAVTYYVRAYATNSSGTTYSEETSFVTLTFQGAASLVVERKNRGLFMDFSETWCPPCGALGGPTFDSLLFHEGTLLTGMKIYGSSTPSTLNTTLFTSFKTAFNISGYPTFYLNNTPMIAGGGAYLPLSANINWAFNIANPFSTAPVVAGVAVRKDISNDSLVISTNVKFYQAQNINLDFKIATYIVEDSIVAAQQITGAPISTTYVHRNLLRTSNNSTNYGGVSINSLASISINQEFAKTFKIKINPLWNISKIKVISVIWKTGSPNIFINSNVAK